MRKEVAPPVSVGDRQLALAQPYERCYNTQVWSGKPLLQPY